MPEIKTLKRCSCVLTLLCLSGSAQAQPETTGEKTQIDVKADSARQYTEAYQSGVNLYRQKKYQLAAKSLQAAAKLPAEDGEAGILLGYCFFEQHQYKQALAQYEHVAASARLISIKNRAQKLAATLDSYMKGICPGNCLKPSMPGWRKMSVPGTPDRLVWMVFPYLEPAGKGGSEYWSNDHMGEVIEYVNGRPVNKGTCPICGGTGKVSLPAQ